LFDRAGRATAGFASLGVGPGDAIALTLRNDFPFREARVGADLYGFKPSARGVLTGPLHHIAPNTFGLYLSAADDLLVMQPRFDPRELLAMIDAYRISTLNVVPTMFLRLLEIPEEERANYDLSSPERVEHNAAPCPIPVKKAMIERWVP
jgi:long-chain acyl-CoA synthetase